MTIIQTEAPKSNRRNPPEGRRAGTSPSGVAARRGFDSVGKPPVGVFLELHGGGLYMGSAAGSDIRNRRLADALGIAVPMTMRIGGRPVSSAKRGEMSGLARSGAVPA
jgi:hypothetical protein